MTTNAQGKVIELADYYPYGEVRIEEKKDGYENDYLFTGQERDEETSLYYYGARYYDSKIGRFTSIDSWSGNLLLPQSLNKYSYTLNNPLKYTDPTGNVPDPSDAATLAAGPFAPFAFLAKEAVEAVILKVVSSVAKDIVSNVFTTPPSPQESPITADVVPQTAPPEPYTTPVAPPLPNIIVDVPPPVEVPQTYVTPVYTAEQVLHDGCGVNMSCSTHSPDFIASTDIVFPVPQGASGPVPVINSNGNQTGTAFVGGAGGANSQVDTIRIMNANTANPDGYVKYENSAQPKKQGVDPYSGETVTHDRAHHSLKSKS